MTINGYHEWTDETTPMGYEQKIIPPMDLAEKKRIINRRRRNRGQLPIGEKTLAAGYLFACGLDCEFCHHTEPLQRDLDYYEIAREWRDLPTWSEAQAWKTVL